MAKQVKFKDREDELAQIDSFIKEKGTLRIICIQADGGIGKTRLLQEVRRRYGRETEQTSLKVTNIIDFDERTYHSREHLGLRIAQELSMDVFEPYRQALDDLRRMVEGGVSQSRVNDQKVTANQIFIDCFNRVADQQRVVLLVDTVDEALEGTGAWEYIIMSVPQLKNVVLLIAGRAATKIGKDLQAEVGEDVQIFSLPPLPKEASESYLLEKKDLLRIPLEPELAQKILFLADGRPILIDLAVDWLAHEVPLDWLIAMSLQELESLSKDELKIRREEFEFQLVAHIADTRHLMDWLILTMAQIYPLDVEMIVELLKVPEAETKVLFKKAQSYAFVKQLPDGRISLHDEMRRMVNAYVWPQVDPDGDRRMRDINLGIEYLNRAIQDLTEHFERLKAEGKAAHDEDDGKARLDFFLEREALEQQLLERKEQLLTYLLRVDLEKSVLTFEQLFEEATRAYQYSFRRALLKQIESRLDELTTEQKITVNSRRAEYLRDERRYEEARQLTLDTQYQAVLTPEQQAELLIEQGRSEIRLGHFEEGWQAFDEAVQICQQHGLQSDLIRALNQRGWAQRIRGDFEKALADYREAYSLSLKFNKIPLQASILNNMARINAYQGNRNSAIKSCETALELWAQLSNPKGEGRTYSSLGFIYRWLDELDEAMDCYAKALEIFTSADDIEWISRARCGRAAVYRVRAKKQEGELRYEELNKAQADLDYGFENGPSDLKPNLFYEQAKVYWHQGKLAEARQQFEACRQSSQEFGETFFDFMSFADLLELAWDFEEYDRWKEYHEQYTRLYTDRQDEESLRLRGSCLRKIADLAICSGAYDAAVEAYKEGLLLISEYEVHERHTTKEVIEQMDQRLQQRIKPDILRRLGQDLAEYWRSESRLFNRYPEVLPTFYKWQQVAQSNE